MLLNIPSRHVFTNQRAARAELRRHVLARCVVRVAGGYRITTPSAAKRMRYTVIASNR